MHTSQEGPCHLKPANSLGVVGRSSKNVTMAYDVAAGSIKGAKGVRGGHQEEERDQMLSRT